MGEEHRLLEGLSRMGDAYRKGDSGQRSEERLLSSVEGEGNQTGSQVRHPEAELPGDPVADVGGSEFREGEPSRGHDQRIGGEGPARRDHLEAIIPHDILHAASAEDPDTRPAALALQHHDDLPGIPVTELLAELLLVVGDAVLPDQRDEIPGRVAGQGRLAEVGIPREVVLRRGVDVGEVAATAP